VATVSLTFLFCINFNGDWKSDIYTFNNSSLFLRMERVRFPNSQSFQPWSQQMNHIFRILKHLLVCVAYTHYILIFSLRAPLFPRSVSPLGVWWFLMVRIFCARAPSLFFSLPPCSGSWWFLSDFFYPGCSLTTCAVGLTVDVSV